MTQLAQKTLRVLGGEECAALGLRVPLAIEIDYDGVGFIVKVGIPRGTDAFGSGESVPDAVADLVEVMRAEAASLRARQEHLAPDLAKELALLDRVLVAEGEAPPVQSTVYFGSPFNAEATGPTYHAAASRNSYIPVNSPVESTI